MVTVLVVVRTRLLVLARRGEQGQAVAEYALVLLGVATVALLVGRWASSSELIGRLLDAVFSQLVDRAT